MRNEVSWFEKYKIALKENLSVKDIMKLRGVGQPTALDIRNKAIAYCLKNQIDVGGKKVPSEVVLLITERDLNYYYDKMKLEVEATRLYRNLIEI